MKIYVAGKWSERLKVKNVMEMFESRGHIITCDWTKHIAPERNVRNKGNGIFTKGYDWSKNEDWAQNGHKTYAEEDLEGVKNCDVLVACMWSTDIFYKGAWIEIGIALGLDKQVIIIGKDITTVFLGLPNVAVVQFKEEVLTIINRMDAQKTDDMMSQLKEKVESECKDIDKEYIKKIKSEIQPGQASPL